MYDIAGMKVPNFMVVNTVHNALISNDSRYIYCELPERSIIFNTAGACLNLLNQGEFGYKMGLVIKRLAGFFCVS